MRTKLKIDDDVLATAKSLAEARLALQPAPQERRYRNGFLLLEVKPGAVPVTLELVNQLSDELP